MVRNQKKSVIVFGDNYGVPSVLRHVDSSSIAGIVAASIRPQYHSFLRVVADDLKVPLLIQPNACAEREIVGEFKDEIARINPDIIICHSYSMRIPSEILALVDGVAFNVHFSLLPSNRGPNPVQWALIHGCAYTGVTLHVMGRDFDTGPIVAQRKLRIEQSDSWVTLMEKLKEVAESLLTESIPKILGGVFTTTIQDQLAASQNSRVPNEGFLIDFSSMDNQTIYNIIRAQVSPLKGVKVKGDLSGRVIDQMLDMSQINQLRKEYGE